VWSGHYADSRGAKRAVVIGLLTAVVGGLLYLLSLGFVHTPWLSVVILLGGRALLGGAESFIITGAVSWGLALAGRANTGRVIAWVGMAMFAALAFGAPVGTTLYALGGFAAVAVATILFPLITVLLVAPLTPVPIQRGAQTGLMKTLGAVWLPGFGSALSTIGFGATIAFSSRLSAERGWNPLWLSFSDRLKQVRLNRKGNEARLPISKAVVKVVRCQHLDNHFNTGIRGSQSELIRATPCLQ
jgi:MFS family permease